MTSYTGFTGQEGNVGPRITDLGSDKKQSVEIRVSATVREDILPTRPQRRWFTWTLLQANFALLSKNPGLLSVSYVEPITRHS